MIAIDTSALLAIVFEEPEADRCRATLAEESDCVMSPMSVSEALIVADRRGLGGGVRALIEELGIRCVPATRRTAYAVAEAYTHWGKGVHPARLNWGDCFSYALAKGCGCPLLFVGDDFSRTDVIAA